MLRQKHILSQSPTPFACTLIWKNLLQEHFGLIFGSLVFDDFGGSGKHLTLLSLVLQNTGQRGNCGGFGGFCGCGGFGRDGYPL